MATYSSNQYLTESQQLENAKYILNFLRSKGWTDNAIFATLGNMQSESSINPGIWEERTTDIEGFKATHNGRSPGYGLVQWTPYSNYLDWAIREGYTTSQTYGELEPQLLRIIYEVDNGLQWIKTDTYPLSFKEYTQSMMDIEYLAAAFLYNYERPAELPQPKRGTQALEWARKLSDEGYQDARNNLFIYPVSIFLKITQSYDATNHTGLDLGWSSVIGGNSQPIVASQRGTVITAVDGYGNDLSAGYGNYVVIEHADGVYTLYGHMAKGSVKVSVGDVVTRGQQIGNMGDSGNSHGNHLHFEYRVGGNSKAYALDPVKYLVAPTTLNIDPNSKDYDRIRVVSFYWVPTVKSKNGFNFVLFNKERRKRLWNVTM